MDYEEIKNKVEQYGYVLLSDSYKSNNDIIYIALPYYMFETDEYIKILNTYL
jgi:hypothetical protein